MAGKSKLEEKSGRNCSATKTTWQTTKDRGHSAFTYISYVNFAYLQQQSMFIKVFNQYSIALRFFDGPFSAIFMAFRHILYFISLSLSMHVLYNFCPILSLTQLLLSCFCLHGECTIERGKGGLINSMKLDRQRKKAREMERTGTCKQMNGVVLR